MQTRDYHLKKHRESWCEVHYANTVGAREVGTPKNIPLGSQVDFLRKAQLAIMLDFRNASGGAFRLKFEPNC